MKYKLIFKFLNMYSRDKAMKFFEEKSLPHKVAGMEVIIYFMNEFEAEIYKLGLALYFEKHLSDISIESIEFAE